MKLNKQQLKPFISGIVIGIAITVASGTVFAAKAAITALLDTGVVFKFNGEEKKPKNGEAALFYNDRLYVPVSFVSENLNCTVKWYNDSRVVEIKSKKPIEKPTEKPTEAETTTEKTVETTTKNEVVVDPYVNDGKYIYTPVRYSNSKFLVELKNIYRHVRGADMRDRLNLRFENLGDYEMQIKADEMKVESGGVEYKIPIRYLPDSLLGVLYPDETLDVEVEFEKLPNNAKTVTVTVPVIYYGSDSPQPEYVIFNARIEEYTEDDK